MSGTLPPVSPTAAYVNMTGIHAPTFVEIRDYLVTQFQSIYGNDIVVTPDSQDGQLIGIFALAIADANAACIETYNAFSPSTAQGVGLSSMVKLNGMARALPSNSSVPLLVIGRTGTIITNGVATDAGTQNRWLLPESVLIGPAGQELVTAVAEQPGFITALPNTITRIVSVTLGWQECTNPVAASPGAPLETDPQLRIRQSVSTANPALTVLSSIVGGVYEVPGVTHVAVYENDTAVTDPVTTLPPHSVALVVQGGDSVEICQTILMHKTPGCFTYGAIRHVVTDLYGLPHDIGFFIPAPQPIAVSLTLIVKPGYSTMTAAAIRASIVNYINALGSGEDVIYSKMWLPANLCDLNGLPIGTGDLYDITSMAIGKVGQPLGAINIPIGIAEVATGATADVTIIV